MKKISSPSFLISFIAIICLPLFSMAQGVLSLSLTGYDAKCNGSASGAAIAIASGGTAPYSYVWVPAVSTTGSAGGLATGVYSVTVTDSHGNKASAHVTISQPAPLIAAIDSIVVRPCFFSTGGGVCGCANTLWAVVSGGTPPYSYLWTPDSLTGDTINRACYLEWTVAVTDNNQCVTNDSLDVTIPGTGIGSGGATGINTPGNITDINVYPNPAINALNISLGQPGAGTLSIEICDMIGRSLLRQTLSATAPLITLDVSTLAGGNYLLKIANGESLKTTLFSIAR